MFANAITRPEWDFAIIPDPSADGGYRSIYADGSAGDYVPLRARAVLGLA